MARGGLGGRGGGATCEHPDSQQWTLWDRTLLPDPSRGRPCSHSLSTSPPEGQKGKRDGPWSSGHRFVPRPSSFAWLLALPKLTFSDLPCALFLIDLSSKTRNKVFREFASVFSRVNSDKKKKKKKAWTRVEREPYSQMVIFPYSS